jgi:hypothetical protein
VPGTVKKSPCFPEDSLQSRLGATDVRGMYNSAMRFITEQAHVLKSLTELEARLGDLTQALAHSEPQLILEPTDSTTIPALQRVCTAFSTITYGVEDSPNQSVNCLAVVGAATSILKTAGAVNSVKARFRQVCTPLQKLRVRVPLSDGSKNTESISALRFILRRVQRSDLNLMAAYRRIPTLEIRPSSVAFSRTLTRAVYRKSIAQIRLMLEGSSGPMASDDLALLSALPRSEKYLALVRDYYENTRANVVYDGLDRRGRGRIQIAAEIPLLYPTRRASAVPAVRFPKSRERLSEKPRQRESKLHKEQFLVTLPVWRYIDERG